MFITTRVEPDLARDLQQHDVVVTGQVESTFAARLALPVRSIARFLWEQCLKTPTGRSGFPRSANRR
jgi:cell division protease FtsH